MMKKKTTEIGNNKTNEQRRNHEGVSILSHYDVV